IYIPDAVSIKDNVEIEDSISNGTSILYPNLFSFPKDLESFCGETIKFQLVDGSQITGDFISYEKDNSPLSGHRVIIDAKECYSEKLTKGLPNGLVSISTTHIQSYFPLSLEPSSKKLAKIIINDNTPREIVVSYDVPFVSDSFNSGYFRHIIKGVDCKSLYTNPNLQTDIPISFKTVYYWVPQWNIYNKNVTLSLVSEYGKETFTIKNFTCTKNYLTQITVNSFESHATRAVLVFPLGGIRISMFFQNNSDFILSNLSKVVFDGAENSTGTTLLKDVKPNTMGLVSFNFENKLIKVYKDIAHQPLNHTKTKEFNICNIKISNIFTLMDTETCSKIDFQFVNATDFKTKYIVNIGEYSEEQDLNTKISVNGREIAKSLYLFDSSPLSINSFQITHRQTKTFMTHNKLPQILINYLQEKGIQVKYNKDKFETFDLSHLDRNTQDTIIKLMSSLYLEEKTSNYFNRSVDPNVSYGLFNELTFANKPNNIGSGLFGSSNQTSFLPKQSPSFSFGTTTTSVAQPSGSIFGGSSSFGAQQAPNTGFGAPTTSLFGAQQAPNTGFGATVTSPFGAQQAPNAAPPLFGAQQTPNATSLFGARSVNNNGFGEQQQQQTPNASSLFGASQPQQSSSLPSFSFGTSQQPQQASQDKGFSFGFGSPKIENTSDSQNSSDNESISSFVNIPHSPKSLFSSTPVPSTPVPTTPEKEIALTSITSHKEFSNKSFEELKLEHNNGSK
ncbi:hypothetical protein DICPUDRAFT_41797, partial [Dictyostelium purpureum]